MSFWLTEEVFRLIAIWSDEEIQSLLESSRRNQGIYERITQEMSASGYSKSANQCKDKIKKLKLKYKKIKDGHQVSGTDRHNWPFFEKIDEVLGTKHSVQPPITIDSSRDQESHDEETSPGPSNSTASVSAPSNNNICIPSTSMPSTGTTSTGTSSTGTYTTSTSAPSMGTTSTSTPSTSTTSTSAPSTGTTSTSAPSTVTTSTSTPSTTSNVVIGASTTKAAISSNSSSTPGPSHKKQKGKSPKKRLRKIDVIDKAIERMVSLHDADADRFYAMENKRMKMEEKYMGSFQASFSQFLQSFLPTYGGHYPSIPPPQPRVLQPPLPQSLTPQSPASPQTQDTDEDII